ncbi:hypothetical protein [Williamsia sp. 1135]|uniref:hypothetical protein n=1 Tax=Williamsia sp. 1135 TaxID=1889262 RepID=UPI000A11850D|nr:hypothetical protein [Williamsia sp. 1135]ORM30512.1 hypothetical protein BFL43_17815 [Williamsia sp. 1135]
MTLVGPDGEETTTTQTIWTVHFGVAGKFKFDYLTFWRAFYSAEAAQQELSAVTARWGIHPDSVTTWNSIAANAGDQKEKFSLGSGVSPTGLVIDMNASTENGVQVFQYFVDLDERRYTPENLASIRATGDDL